MSSDSSTGRNSPCPCGSEKKYKKCCLSKDEMTAVKSQRPESSSSPSSKGRKGQAKTTGNEFSHAKPGNFHQAGGAAAAPMRKANVPRRKV